VSRDRSGRAVPQAEFAISRSVLAEVVRTKQSVLSSDARVDARFVRQASVLALDLRSVLVAPLVARGQVMGAIYLDNLQSSGVFDDADRDLLGLLATQAAVAVENARLHATRLQKELMDQELGIARAIQQGLLPRSLPGSASWRVAASMEPARDIGGDWYDFVEGPGGVARIMIGDVSGKGVPAGLFMIMARTILRSIVTGEAPLDQLLADANDAIEDQIEDDKFLTLLLLEPAADGRLVRLCLAGHEPPVLQRADGSEPILLPAGGLALGMLRGISDRLDERTVELGKGDVLACYSDGVTECRAPDGAFFGRDRLLRSVRAVAGTGAEAVRRRVESDLAAFRGTAERSDDVTLVVLEAL
jgi:serine phosphatase RsbU (regulator of sigma subunit)